MDVKGLPKEKDWDPRSLFKILPANQIKIGEVIIEIVGCFAAIVIFNFYPQIIGFTPSLNSVVATGNWNSVTFVSLLSSAFFYYIPYLTLVWALTIILDIVLLRMGAWNTLTRVCLISLKIINIIIAASMLAGPSLIASSSASLVTAVGVEGAHILTTFLSQVIPVLLWITILGNSLEIIKAFSRMISSKPLPFIIPGKN